MDANNHFSFTAGKSALIRNFISGLGFLPLNADDAKGADLCPAT